MNHEFEMEKELLEKFTDATNRSKNQTAFLFNLLKGDLKKLAKLEEKIKNNHLFYCPADMQEVKSILEMNNGTAWFSLKKFKNG